MTAGVPLILRKTGAHRAPLQQAPGSFATPPSGRGRLIHVQIQRGTVVLEEPQISTRRLARTSTEQNKLRCVVKAPNRAVDEDGGQEFGKARRAAFVARRSRCHQEIAAFIVS